LQHLSFTRRIGIDAGAECTTLPFGGYAVKVLVDRTRRETSMDHEEDPGLDFIEGFSLLAGAIWIIGALVLGAMVMMGLGRV
jgi:hypothetical protein